MGGTGHHSPGGRLAGGVASWRCRLGPCSRPASIRHCTAGTLPQGWGCGGFCPAELLTPRPGLPGASSSSSRSPSGPHGPPSLPAVPTPLSDHRPLQPRQVPIPASARHPSCCGRSPFTPEPGRDQPRLTSRRLVEGWGAGSRRSQHKDREPPPAGRPAQDVWVGTAVPTGPALLSGWELG